MTFIEEGVRAHDEQRYWSNPGAKESKPEDQSPF
jgi:hypothetical protein